MQKNAFKLIYINKKQKKNVKRIKKKVQKT